MIERTQALDEAREHARHFKEMAEQYALAVNNATLTPDNSPLPFAVFAMGRRIQTALSSIAVPLGAVWAVSNRDEKKPPEPEWIAPDPNPPRSYATPYTPEDDIRR